MKKTERIKAENAGRLYKLLQKECAAMEKVWESFPGRNRGRVAKAFLDYVKILAEEYPEIFPPKTLEKHRQ